MVNTSRRKFMKAALTAGAVIGLGLWGFWPKDKDDLTPNKPIIVDSSPWDNSNVKSKLEKIINAEIDSTKYRRQAKEWNDTDNYGKTKDALITAIEEANSIYDYAQKDNDFSLMEDMQERMNSYRLDSLFIYAGKGSKIRAGEYLIFVNNIQGPKQNHSDSRGLIHQAEISVYKIHELGDEDRKSHIEKIEESPPLGKLSLNIVSNNYRMKDILPYVIR